MAITIQNLRIIPYTQKDNIKPIYGDTLELTFTLPETYIAGDAYILGLDNERILIPTARELCAYTEDFTINGNNITFSLEIRSKKFRDWASSIRKPMPVWLQIQRKRNDIYETILLDDVLALPSLVDGDNTVYHGDPLETLLDAKLDKPANSGVAGDVLTLDSNGDAIWQEAGETSWESITSKPDFASVAYTGQYNDLNGKPALATVASTGKYNDLSGKPAIPVVNNAVISFVQGNETKGTISLNQGNNATISFDDGIDSVSWNDIAGKPNFATVASTGKYNDLTGKPTIPTVNNPTITFTQGGATKGTISLNQSSNATIAFDAGGSAATVSWNDIQGKPTFASVATTGKYSDLISKPTFATVASTGNYNDLTSKPNLATVATTGKYSDLVSKPTIPTVYNPTISFTQGGVSKGAITLNQSNNATIAFDSNDVSWDEITSKPNFASVAITGSYEDLSNKPTIPTVNNATISLIQNGITKGTFSLNQNTDSSITLDAGGSADFVDYTPYLCFTNERTGTSTLYLTAANNLTLNLEYSFDKRSWSTYTFSGVTGQTITLSSKGDKVYFRGTNQKMAKSSGAGTYSYFTMTGKIAASGKVMSLLDATCTQEEVPSYAFPGLFKDCAVLTTAPEMPQKDLDSYCFYQMYRNCSSLQHAPELMCDMVAINAYGYIFAGCSSLFSVKIGFSTLGISYTGSWLDGVSELGTLVAPSTLAYTSAGKNTVPSGWDVIRIPAQMDNTLTSESKNPVENGVLYTALASKADAVAEIQSTGAIVTIESAVANTHYACGEITTLTINACEKSIYETIITFTNGATPCVISLPENVNTTHVEEPISSSDYLLTIKYNIAFGYNVAEVSSGGGDITASGGTQDFASLNGAWIEAGTTTVSGVTAPYYSISAGNNTYYLTRVYSNFEGGIIWAITSYDISSEAEGWIPSVSEASMAYTQSSADSPVGLTFSVTYMYSGSAPTFSNGGGGGVGTVTVTGCATASYNGTYSAYDMSGKGGTQTYSNGTAYIFRLEDDDNDYYWCIHNQIIDNYSQPGTPSNYYVQTNSLTIPSSGWQNCSAIVNS